MNRLQWRLIRNERGKPFLFRITWHNEDGTSYKLHVFLRSDQQGMHTHPWDFRSVILFAGYNEIYSTSDSIRCHTYGWLHENVKQAGQEHQVLLRKCLGIPIPAVTFGLYGRKKQPCSFCQELGRCMNVSG